MQIDTSNQSFRLRTKTSMNDEQDRSEVMKRLATIGSVGTEMAAPIGIGVLIDYWLGTMPWFTIALTIFGFVGGLYHLIILNRPRDRQ